MRKALFLSIGILVGAGLIEALHQLLIFTLPLNCYQREPCPAIGWRYVPHSFYMLTAGEGRSKGWFNSEGFRDYDHQIEKQKEITRIAILGDSYVECLGIPLDRAFPALLEKKLIAQGKKAGVLTFGLSGWGTTAQKIAYENIVRKYQPHIVISFMGFNDYLDNVSGSGGHRAVWNGNGVNYLPSGVGFELREDTSHRLVIPKILKKHYHEYLRLLSTTLYKFYGTVRISPSTNAHAANANPPQFHMVKKQNLTQKTAPSNEPTVDHSQDILFPFGNENIPINPGIYLDASLVGNIPFYLSYKRFYDGCIKIMAAVIDDLNKAVNKDGGHLIVVRIPFPEEIYTDQFRNNFDPSLWLRAYPNNP
ncbi:MAG: hypothetical protein LHV69_00640 [Elusimicrobia bacterium]|nr:hypothetical protein [Candidatus Obscuribacterium magneticum]